MRPAFAPGTTIPAGTVRIPGGTFTMGSNRHYPEEAPAHPVKVDALWMDATPVTNAQFRRFVGAAGYMTFCEQRPDPAQYPGTDPRGPLKRWNGTSRRMRAHLPVLEFTPRASNRGAIPLERTT